MTTHSLNRERFYHSFMAGAKEVIRRKDHLNEINVFPVADGDTGSNLASLMQTILSKSNLEESNEKTLKSIIDAALIGARGNSGIIFASYFNGWLSELSNKDPIALEDFALALEAAVPYAYDAIETPVEGTMITLMKDFAESIKTIKTSTKDFNDTLEKALETLKVSLEHTKVAMKKLRNADVVDAGAKGFIHFIEGFTLYMKTGEDLPFDIDEAPSVVQTDHLDFDAETYRYCTEALIKGDNLSQKALKNTVKSLGDSIVVAGNDNILRLHIHTDVPQDVFYHLRSYGAIIEQKVDDMKKQHEIVHNRKYKTALVTDSIADLPKAYIDEKQIHVIPINLMIEDSNYYDKLTISSENFYQFMDTLSTYPKSAQPNQKQVENFYSFLSSYYDDIIVLSVSEKMSGTYNVFKQAAKTLDDSKTSITVIDSMQNSGAEGLLVMKAQEWIEAGKTPKEIEEGLVRLRSKTKILVSVKTLKYMVRSGRLKKATGLIGKAVNLKPVISIDDTGEGIIFDKAFSLKKANNKIKAHIEKIAKDKGIDRYAIVHANALDRANAYATIFENMLNQKPEYVIDISTVVAMNAGIGTVAIAYIEKD